MKKYKICVITATRAEYGLLSSVIREIYNDNDCQLQLIVTGTHLEKEYGNTIEEIINDGFPILRRVSIYHGTTDLEVLETMSDAIREIGIVLNEIKPHIVLLLGDRYELHSIASACVMLKVPIGHISGGEISQGAYDEYFRHSITKLSTLHFTSTLSHRNRVIQMGESPSRVFNVGDLGIENVKSLQRITREDLEKDLKFKIDKPLIQVTFHPTTLENDSVEQFKELLSALDEKKHLQIVFTRSNADNGGEELNKLTDEFVKINSERSKVFSSLGYKRFLSLLSYSLAIVGNSSSGIVEAPYLRIGTINIGNRQQGRECAESIINCIPKKDNILKALEIIESKSYKDLLQNFDSPYESNGTSKKIVDIVKQKISEDFSLKKKFFDIDIGNINE